MDLLPLLQATGTLVALFLLSKIWMSKNTTTNKHANKTFTQAPQPKGAWPILGHLHLLGGQIPLFRTLAAMADQHGPIFTIRLGFRQAVVVSSKQTVTECFTVNDRAFMSHPQTAALKYMGYNGAFSALGPSDDYWLQLRKVTTHDLLSNRHLESFKHVRALEMDLSIKELYSLSIKNECKVKVSEWFRQVTMNLMLRAIVGKRYSFGDCESDKEGRQFARAMEEFTYLSGAPECSDVIPGIEWLDLQGNVKAMKRNGKEMDKFMSMWLEEHVHSRREGKVKKDKRDFMDVLLSCFPEDGDGMVFGHKSQDIIKATALLLQGFDLETLSRNGKVDMSEGLGIVLPKATPLEVLLTPRLSSEFYDQPSIDLSV
ncbi:Xanthotoxin 5-hydroxylase CYP82C4 [Camellia lanceoleosa]|uniref:Xanthotoxin 5-hydroxylase CYP82C4 n=1 Tax=Camellia lanceoleosa TaxID=1840588 RepID=A0ACC0HR44_9ERIC|nr:Xanthotoxin 5-hydroxylase CYP82C4 [Camellia lanceoleosa]